MTIQKYEQRNESRPVNGMDYLRTLSKKSYYQAMHPTEVDVRGGQKRDYTPTSRDRKNISKGFGVQDSLVD